MAYPAIDIAQYIVNWFHENKRTITNLKLQKLLYFVWQDYYKKTGKYLFNEGIYAWPLGPVVPDVYYDYCTYGGDPIEREDSISLDTKIEETLNSIISKYIDISARKLVDMTHQEGTPWYHTFQRGNRLMIPFEEIIESLDQEC